MRKAELSLPAIAGIVLGVLGFLLVIAFLSQTLSGKEFFCQNVYQYTGRLGILPEDVCNTPVKLQADIGQARPRNLSLLPNQRAMQGFPLRAGSPERFSLSLPRGAKVRNASVLIQNGNNFGHITRFNDKDFTAVVPFGYGGGTNTFYLNLSSDIVVSRAKLKVTGYNIPGKLDLVFVIDQSGSMRNEWDDICGSIDALKDNLSRTGLGVDVQSTIYGLSDFSTATYGSCRDSVISNAQLDGAIAQMGIPFTQPSPVLVPGTSDEYTYAPFDQYSEAWAVGTTWATQNHPWRPNTKRILFPVSDSDPTGGGPAHVRVDANGQVVEILQDALFTGNENQAVLAADAATQAAGVYVFPIFGDEDQTQPARSEGYHVGTGGPTGCDPNDPAMFPYCGCAQQYQAVCGPILQGMRQLTHFPISRLAGYKNPEELRRFAQYVLTTQFPHDVEIRVDGQIVFFQPGPLDNQNSPQWLDESVFKAALESAANACPTSSCIVPVTISSTTEGAVILSDLDIIYQKYIHDAELTLNGTPIFTEPRFVDRHQVNFTPLAQSLMNCGTPQCTFDFALSASQPATILLSNLSISYHYLFLAEDVLDASLECWASAKLKNFEDRMRCTEIAVPPGHVFYTPLTEADITAILQTRHWCDIFGNADQGCGSADQLRFLQDISAPTNILIEFDPARKQVVVS